MLKIAAENLSHRYNQRTIFRNISFQIERGHSLVLVGPNGSGKTTLIRIICNLVRPTAGNIRVFQQQREIPYQQIYPQIGLVGPYLQLYNQLTAYENYVFFARIRRMKVDQQQFRKLMEKMNLRGREWDELRTFSSGMLQRMKYILAIMHQPQILILDEPTANLDQPGAEIVYELMETQKKDRILILATNEPGEARFGEEKISLVP